MGLFSKKVVTQNDIAKIIKSQIEFSDEVVNVILKSKIVKKDTDIAKINKKMNDLKNTLGLLFGSGGIFETLNSVAASLNVVENIKNMKLRPYKRALKKLFKLMNSIISYSLRISLQHKGLLIAIPALLATHMIINNWAGIMFALDKVSKINSWRIRRKIRGWHRILRLLYHGDDNDGKGSKKSPSFLKHLELFSVAVLEQLKWGRVITALSILTIIFAELFAVMYTISKTPTVVIIPKLVMLRLDINHMTKFLINLNDKIAEIQSVVKFKDVTFNLLKIVLVFILVKMLFTIISGISLIALLVTFAFPIISAALYSTFGLYKMLLMFNKVDKKSILVASENIILLIGVLISIAVAVLPIIDPLTKISQSGIDVLIGLGFLALFIVAALTTLFILKYIYKKIFEKHTKEIAESLIAIKAVMLEFAALINIIVPLIGYFNQINDGFMTIIKGLGFLSMIIISMLTTLLTLKYIYKRIFEKHTVEITSTILAISDMVLKISALMTEIVVLIKLGEQINNGFKTIMISLGLIPVIISAIYGVAVVLMYMDRKLFRKYYRPILLALRRVNILIASFMIIITAVVALAVVALKLADNPEAILSIFAIIMIIVIGILGIAYVISKMVKAINTLNLLKSLFHIILIAAALIVIGLEILLFATIAQDLVDRRDAINQALLSLVIFILEIVMIGVVASIISPLAQPALIAIGVITLLVGAIFLMAWMLTGLAKLHIDEDTIKEKINIVVRCVLYIFDAIFNSLNDNQGQESPSFLDSILNTWLKMYQSLASAVLLIAAIVSVFCILLIAGMLRIIQEIELDDKKIFDTVSKAIYIVNTIMAMIFKPISFEQDTSSTQKYTAVLDYGAGDNNAILMVLKSLLGAIYLIFTFIAVTMLLLIALELKMLEEIDLNVDAVLNNVNKIITCARDVMDSIFSPQKPNDPEKADQPWYKDVLDWFSDFFGAIGKIIMAILAVVYLAVTTIAVGLIYLLAKCLSFIQTVELKPTEIQAKVKDIMDTAHFTIQAVVNYKKPSGTTTNGEEKSLWQKCLDSLMPDSLKGIIDAVMAVGQLAALLGVVFLIKQLADSLNTIKDFKLETGIDKKVNDIVTAANKVYEAVSTNKGKELSFNEIKYADRKAETISDVLESVADFSNQVDDGKFVQTTEAYCKFMDKLNGVDLVKLQTTERLFKNMASFAQSIHGNFDKLADSLNEKIAPLLEKLEKGVSDLNKDMNNNAKDQMKNDIEIANGSVSPDSINKAAGGDKDTASKLQKDQAKKNEKDKKQYQGMQDIMDILLGQGGHKGVKIHN